MNRKGQGRVSFLLFVALLGWAIPGAGHFIIGERKRSVIIFVTILLTFCAGIYIGSIGVVDLTSRNPVYVKVAQVMNTPVVFWLSDYASVRGLYVYGWPGEVGQVYTMTAGLLNLLCIVNAVYVGHAGRGRSGED